MRHSPPGEATDAEALWQAQIESRQLRSRGALAAEGAPELLLDRLGRAREQCRRRPRAAADRSRAAALPLRRLLPRAGTAGRARRRSRRDAGRRRRDRRADRRWPAQGLRPSRARRDPPDLDDRLPPAARRRRRDRDRQGAQARGPGRLAGRRRRRLQLRRRLAEPCDGAGRSQHHRPCRPPAPPGATALRLRGQRPRDQRPLALRLGRERARESRDIRYESVAGDDPAAVLASSRELADWVRETRRPAVLHLRTVRYLGHAGADVEAAYRSPAEVRADLDARPARRHRAWLVAAGARTGARLVRGLPRPASRVRGVALAAARRPQLECAAEVVAPLAPRSPAAVAELARSDAAAREPVTEPLTLALAINGALGDALERHPETLLFGEDVAAKGGVYGVTRGLHARSAPGACSTRCSTRRRSSVSRSVRGHRLRASPRDPVPGVSPQRRGPAPRRGSDAAVLLAGPVPQRHGGADRRVRLPEGFRRPLPQRRLGRRPARHSRPRDRVAGAAGRCRRDAAHVRRGCEGRRQRLRLPRADRALPHA